MYDGEHRSGVDSAQDDVAPLIDIVLRATGIFFTLYLLAREGQPRVIIGHGDLPPR